jgi:hypothetical protein
MPQQSGAAGDNQGNGQAGASHNSICRRPAPLVGRMFDIVAILLPEIYASPRNWSSERLSLRNQPC